MPAPKKPKKSPKQTQIALGPTASHGAKLSRQAATLRAQGYIGVAEVAHLLQNEIGTVYKWVDAKIVDGVVIGHRKYVKLSSVISHVGNDVARIFGLIDLQETIKNEAEDFEE
jgi:hypothetical protein